MFVWWKCKYGELQCMARISTNCTLQKFWLSDEHLFSWPVGWEFAFSLWHLAKFKRLWLQLLMKSHFSQCPYWRRDPIGFHTEVLRWVDESCGRKVCAAKQRFSSSFRVLKGCGVCVCVCVSACVCSRLYILPPPLSRSSPELPSLCFGTRSHLLWCSAGRYTTGAALSLWAVELFGRGRKGRGRLKTALWCGVPSCLLRIPGIII